MESRPKFSVIVSALNEEKVIEETIKAVMAQRNKNFELIVSDGLSKDRTVEIARKYTNNVISSKDKNLGYGRNKGAAVAKGDILVFLDADTRMTPDTLDIIKHIIDKGYVGGSFPVKYWDANKGNKLASKFFNELYKALDVILPVGYGPCMFFDRKIFELVGGFSHDVIYEDMEIARRIFMKFNKKLKFVSKHFVYASARRLKEKGFLGYCATDAKLFLKDLLKMKTDYHGEYGGTVKK